MRYPALLALSIGLVAALPSHGAAQAAAPENPCADSLYQALRAKPLNDLTEREYEYFKQREKTCTEFQRLAALASRPANAPAPRRDRITSETFTRIAGSGNAVDVIVRNTSEVPIIVNSVRVFDCRNVRDTSCTLHYPKTRIRPNEQRRVITIRFDSGLDGNSYRYEYNATAAEEEGERQ